MNSLDVSAISQAIDTTWGRSSTPKTASYSVKMSMSGERLLVSYVVILNCASSRQLSDYKRDAATEADVVVAATIKRVKEVYKELTGKTLKAKMAKDSINDSVEIININIHNAKRTAYFRRKLFFELA